jgi:hypothetical protein
MSYYFRHGETFDLDKHPQVFKDLVQFCLYLPDTTQNLESIALISVKSVLLSKGKALTTPPPPPKFSEDTKSALSRVANALAFVKNVGVLFTPKVPPNLLMLPTSLALTKHLFLLVFQGTEVKAITYSNMQVYDDEEKHEVYVIIDI